MKNTGTLSALRTELATRRVIRQRNRRLSAELADYATPAERLELESILSRHTSEEIAELEAMINRPLLVR